MRLHGDINNRGFRFSKRHCLCQNLTTHVRPVFMLRKSMDAQKTCVGDVDCPGTFCLLVFTSSSTAPCRRPQAKNEIKDSYLSPPSFSMSEACSSSKTQCFVFCGNDTERRKVTLIGQDWVIAPPIKGLACLWMYLPTHLCGLVCMDFFF